MLRAASGRTSARVAGGDLSKRQAQILRGARLLGALLAVGVVILAAMAGKAFLDRAADKRAAGRQEVQTFIAKVRACYRHSRPHVSWQECERRISDLD